MKIAIIALSAAALVSAVPAVAVQGGSSKTPDGQHHVAKKYHAGVAHDARRHVMHARGAGAFGYAPAAPSVSDQDFIRSRQFGGGGSGGSM